MAANDALTPMIVYNVAYTDSMPQIPEARNDVDELKEESFYVEAVNAGRGREDGSVCTEDDIALDKPEQIQAGRLENTHQTEMQDTTESDSKPVRVPVFNYPLVLENDSGIEMEYVKTGIVSKESDGSALESDSAPSTSSKIQPAATDPVFLKVESAESNGKIRGSAIKS